MRVEIIHGDNNLLVPIRHGMQARTVDALEAAIRKGQSVGLVATNGTVYLGSELIKHAIICVEWNDDHDQTDQK